MPVPRRLPAHRRRRERRLPDHERVSVGSRRLRRRPDLRASRRRSWPPARRASPCVHIDTTGMVNATSPVAQTEPGFTVWPAQSPGNGSFERATGTEYFMSSNAGEEAARSPSRVASTNQSSVGADQHSSLNSATPALTLSNQVLNVGTYAIPPKSSSQARGRPRDQRAAGTLHQRQDDRDDRGRWLLAPLFSSEPAHNEVISKPDSNDTRMQQVTFANGKLWGSLDTAITPTVRREPRGRCLVHRQPERRARSTCQGYLGAAGHDFTYPAIGVTSSGRGSWPSPPWAPLNPERGLCVNRRQGWRRRLEHRPGRRGRRGGRWLLGYKAQVGELRRGPDGATTGPRPWTATPSGLPASTSPLPATTPPGAAHSSPAAPATTCSARVPPSPGAAGPRAALGNWSTRISSFKP